LKRHFFYFAAVTLLLVSACATKKAESPHLKEVTLKTVDHAEGEPSALLQVENPGKHTLLYEGPQVETKTNGDWQTYAAEVPEMAVLNHTHAIAPGQNDAWWVRVPRSIRWRAYIRCRWAPAHEGEPASPDFVVWLKESET